MIGFVGTPKSDGRRILTSVGTSSSRVLFRTASTFLLELKFSPNIKKSQAYLWPPWAFCNGRLQPQPIIISCNVLAIPLTPTHKSIGCQFYERFRFLNKFFWLQSNSTMTHIFHCYTKTVWQIFYQCI